MKHALFPANELAVGEVRVVAIGRVSIMVWRSSKGFHALRDVCPHEGARLSRGRLLEETTSDGHDYALKSDTFVVRCPWHAYEFDVDTGRCVADPRIAVRSYPVTLEDGLVVLER